MNHMDFFDDNFWNDDLFCVNSLILDCLKIQCDESLFGGENIVIDTSMVFGLLIFGYTIDF